MIIRKVNTIVVGAPWRELTFVELETDDGRTGIGEVRMVNKTQTLLACVSEMADRYVIGADPFDLEKLAWGVQWLEYGRAGEVAQSALAAIDMACWDLIGQAVEQPLWRVLGGAFRDEVPAYANGWYQGDRDPATIAGLARAVTDRGYRALKLDPFGAAAAELSASELTRSVAIVAAVREAIGEDVGIMLEMHGRFRSSAAIRAMKAVEPFGIEWMEEPVPPGDLTGLRNVRSACASTIATGERVHAIEDFIPMFERGLVDVVQADLSHFGGLTGLRKLAGWAAAYNLTMAPHNVCGPVGTAANVHFGLATPNYKVLEHFNDFSDPWVADLVDHPPVVDPATGAFSRIDRPGLGLKLNKDACAEHPSSDARFNLFASGWERREGVPTEDLGDRSA